MKSSLCEFADSERSFSITQSAVSYSPHGLSLLTISSPFWRLIQEVFCKSLLTIPPEDSTLRCPP